VHLVRYELLLRVLCGVSTTLRTLGNLVEFEIAPGNTGNLLEHSIISSAVFTRQAIFSTLYMGKSSGKQDHYDLGLLYGLPGKDLVDFSWKLVRLHL